MDSNLFATKSIEQLVSDVEHSGRSLRRSLTAWDLTLLGIGAIIGTGIFVLTGTAAANQAGPAITMSYLAAGLACAFAALCYAEFASMIPIAGSAYTYAYATLGELVAWMIGWDLILEYAVGSMTVAIGWSGYMQRLLSGVGIVLPLSCSSRISDSMRCRRPPKKPKTRSATCRLASSPRWWFARRCISPSRWCSPALFPWRSSALLPTRCPARRLFHPKRP